MGKEWTTMEPESELNERNVISKKTEGFWTKLEPEVPPGIPLSSSSKLSESNVGIPYTSKQTSPKP